MNMLFRLLKWLDANIEKWLIILTYSAMSTIIFSEVVLRFFFKVQHIWSTSMAIYMFIFIAWIGAAYIAKERSHLSFPALRAKLSYNTQFMCLCFDYVCWVVLSIFAFIASYENIGLMMDNWAMVPGTDLMLWPYYLSIPIGWALLIYRVTTNLVKDFKAFKAGDPLIEGCPGRNR